MKDWLAENQTVFKTWFINGGMLAAITWSNLEMFLKCLLLAVTIGYTIWKWLKESK